MARCVAREKLIWHQYGQRPTADDVRLCYAAQAVVAVDTGGYFVFCPRASLHIQSGVTYGFNRHRRFFAIRIFRRFPVLRIPLMYGIIISVSAFTFLILFMPDMMFDLIGKERTLTGRTDIWQSLILAGKEQPLLGYGYGTFWSDPNGPSYWVRFSLEWGVPTAHNGWMETWLSAGLVAVVLFAVLYLFTLMLALDRLYRGGTENYWVILSTILFFMISMSESTILQQNDLSWVIFVATSAKLFSFAPAYWRNRPKMPYFQPPQPRTALA